MNRHGPQNIRVAYDRSVCKYADKHHKGFTLMEILIVVAVIAILVAIAIPVFTSQLERVRKATCDANRRSLKAEVSVNLMSDSSFAGSDYMKNFEYRNTYTCPSGGTITAGITDDSIVNVTCSIHSPSGEDAFAALADELNNTNSKIFELFDSFKLKSGESLDYPLPDSAVFAGRSSQIVAAAAEAGINISEGSWKVYKWGSGSYSLYYYDGNVLDAKKGDIIGVTQWYFGDPKQSGVTKYTGSTKVTQGTVNGVTYNKIEQIGKENMQ